MDAEERPFIGNKSGTAEFLIFVSFRDEDFFVIWPHMRPAPLRFCKEKKKEKKKC